MKKARLARMKSKGHFADKLLLISGILSLSFCSQAVRAQESSSGSSDSSGSSGGFFGSSFGFSDSGSSASSAPPSSSLSPSSASGPSGSASGGDRELTPVNPLQGLFQQQPQYPTPGTTIMFPEAVSPNMGKDGDVPGRNPGQAGTVLQNQWKDPYAQETEKNVTTVNPLQGLFQQQPQYPSPGKTEMYPEAVPNHLGKDSDVQGRNPGQAGKAFQVEWKDPYAEPKAESKDKTNYLKGLFQPQPQYPRAGETVMFPEAIQKNLGSDADQAGRQPGSSGNVYQPQANADIGLPAEALTGASGDKKESDQEKKEGEDKSKKEGEDKDKKDGDDKDKKDGEDKDKKEGDDKDKKDGEDKDKKEGEDKDKKDGDKKDGDKKDGDKKDGDKKDGDKKDGDKKDGDKKDGDKKDGDKKDGDKKEEKKEEVKYAPFNPLREAISLMNSGKFTESIAMLDKEIKKTPNHPQALYTRAVVYVKMRRYDLAAQDYKEVLKLVPSGPLSELAKSGLSKIHF